MDGVGGGIGAQVQDLFKGMRVLKQRWHAEHPVVPSGLQGLLMEIDRLAGCHSRDLAAQAGLDPSTVSRAVSALVSHGLVARQPDVHDGRATVLRLTEAGRAALDEAARWYDRQLAAALDGWTAEEVAAFSLALGRFTTALKNSRNTEAPS